KTKAHVKGPSSFFTQSVSLMTIRLNFIRVSTSRKISGKLIWLASSECNQRNVSMLPSTATLSRRFVLSSLRASRRLWIAPVTTIPVPKRTSFSRLDSPLLSSIILPFLWYFERVEELLEGPCHSALLALNVDDGVYDHAD